MIIKEETKSDVVKEHCKHSIQCHRQQQTQVASSSTTMIMIQL